LARIGWPDQKIFTSTLGAMAKKDMMGPPLHCLIIPGKLHEIEQEMLDLWK